MIGYIFISFISSSDFFPQLWHLQHFNLSSSLSFLYLISSPQSWFYHRFNHPTTSILLSFFFLELFIGGFRWVPDQLSLKSTRGLKYSKVRPHLRTNFLSQHVSCLTERDLRISRHFLYKN